MITEKVTTKYGVYEVVRLDDGTMFLENREVPIYCGFQSVDELERLIEWALEWESRHPWPSEI